MTYENRQDLCDKMRWEGGLEMFLDYGLSLEDLPANDPDLYEAASIMLDAWYEYQRTTLPFLDLFDEEEIW
jgi:hypothetical protein